MQTARLRAIEPPSRAVILASQADKSAPSSEPLRPAWAMPQVVYMLDLLDSFKPSENITKYDKDYKVFNHRKKSFLWEKVKFQRYRAEKMLEIWGNKPVTLHKLRLS